MCCVSPVSKELQIHVSPWLFGWFEGQAESTHPLIITLKKADKSSSRDIPDLVRASKCSQPAARLLVDVRGSKSVRCLRMVELLGLPENAV